jgi:hypothetical protein
VTQPSYVPITDADLVRPAYRLRTPLDWRQDRVAELRPPVHPRGRELGVPGPDQGYALLIAHKLFEDRLQLSEGISSEDALVGCAELATARAGIFGRAPVGKDVELGLMLFGFLGGAPEDLVTWRKPLFRAAGHHYLQRRQIVDSVPESVLRLAAEEVRNRLPTWRSLLGVPADQVTAQPPIG